MFLDNPTVRRSKSIGENGVRKKKKAFDENVSAKTPRRNRKDPAPYRPRGTASRGNIPDQKAAGGGGTEGITASALKRTSSSDAARGSSRLVDGGASCVSSSTSGRASLVGFPEAPYGVGGAAAGGPQTGGAVRGAPEPDYDGAFEAATWWSSADDMADDDGVNDEGRSPLDFVPEEESDAASHPREEMLERCKWESDKMDALEIERCEERFSRCEQEGYGRDGDDASKLEVVAFLGRR